MSELELGTTFGDYRIEGFCGQGGMGVVYRGKHLTLGRSVALKVLAPEFADNPMFRERFKRESQIAASIDHPNVIPVYEAGEAYGRLFIAMRYVEGTDLRALLTSQARLEPAKTIELVCQLGAALDAAHARGLVHRDVKPGNVLLAEHDHVYLTDFGVTKHMNSMTEITRAGELIGTTDYCPPEQIRGEPLDARADVYSLGCLLFECLTGRTPYERGTAVATIWAHLNDPPPSPARHVDGLPDALDKVIARALAKDPDERFPSAGDVASAARAALSHTVLPTRERSVATGGAAPAELGVLVAEAASRSGSRRAEGEAPWRRRAPHIPSILSTLAVVAVLAAVLLVTGVLGGSRARVAGGKTIEVGHGPSALAVRNGAVWVVNSDSDTVSRIDAGAGKAVEPPTPVGSSPAGVAVGPAALWVSLSADGIVRRIDLSPGPVRGRSIDVGHAPGGLAIGAGYVWVTNQGDNTVTRIKRVTGEVVGEPIPVGSVPTEIVVAGRFAWVTNRASSSVTRIDAHTGEVVGEPIRVGGEPRGIAAGAGGVWVANYADDTITRIDVETGKVVGQGIAVGNDPVGVAVDGNVVWVTSHSEDALFRIDARTGSVIGEPVPVGNNPTGVAVGGGAVWVANGGGGSVTRIDQ